MRYIKKEFIFLLLVLIISVMFVADLFINTGLPASFDSPFHITNIAQYTLALQSGDFPVIWQNGFANYGLPIGLIAHQLPSYLGALINLVIDNPTQSYVIVISIGVLLTNILYYFFLRIYFSGILALLGTFLFNFSAYRIINLYIRGAEPELFSNLFVPLICICLYYFIIKKQVWAVILFTFSIFLLAVTHPMNFAIYFFVIAPYFLFLLIQGMQSFSLKKFASKENIRVVISLIFCIGVGMGMAVYYLLPLNIEIKYFYYGLSTGQLTPNQYLGIANYFSPNWSYFSENDIFTRGHFIKSGLLETLTVVAGVLVLCWLFVKRKIKKSSLLVFAVPTSLIFIFLTTPFAEVVYTNISILSNIQFPWRMLNGFIFLPPIIVICLLSLLPKGRNIVMILLVITICITRFPQLYGKNYTVHAQDRYYMTTENIHSVLMNTIWMGEPQEYQTKDAQAAIIGGEGVIQKSEVSNSWRKYTVDAKTPIHLVDYTFYFPGWSVYVDGIQRDIQFQDPNHRGVITYMVDPGVHEVFLKFEDTKIRLVSKVLSIIFFAVFMAMFLLRKKLTRFIIIKV